MDKEVVDIYLDDIIPNRFQPREVFDDNALKELALSIREHGVIQPIIVRKIGTKYEIIAGERRYKASTIAGLTKIPAIVRNLDDKESSKVALIENLQRKDLTPIEEARTYQKILDIDNMTQEELAKTMGKSQSAVSNKLRLLSLSDKIQNALLNEKISERHARALLNLEDESERDRLTDVIIEKKLSVKDLEEIIKNGNTTVEDAVVDNETNNTTVASSVVNTVDVTKEENIPSISFDDLFVKLNSNKEQVEKVVEANKEVETLDLLDEETEDDYYSFEGLKEINITDISKCIEIIRDAVEKVRLNGFNIKCDELDLERNHRFIIEIEKKDN